MPTVDPFAVQAAVSIVREPAYTPMTPRKREICWRFGIPPREDPRTLADGVTVRLSPGSILLLVGPSGSGKSSLLAALTEQAGEVAWVGRGRFPTGRAIVDAVSPNRPLAVALEILTACGLGEPRLWVRPFDDLSDGEKFRACLARAVGQSLGSPPRPVVCDEFTALLHRRAARAVAYNLRKLVSREKLILFVASAHEDIIEDLQPDQIIHLGAAAPTAAPRVVLARSFSLARRAAIERGSVRDYHLFSPMHYRHRDRLGFVDQVFLLRESPHGQPLGILVFAHAPLELAQRNRCTAGRFVRNPRRLNRELRILRRLVMHPDVRGCGLGHWFVRNTLPRVGVRFVECLAAMGSVNPVFERAGLTRVGRCPVPRGRLALLERLERWSIDPFAPDFPEVLARCPRVRKLVEATVRRWVVTTQGARQYRVEGRAAAALTSVFRQAIGEPPVYYLWDRHGVFPQQAADDGPEGLARSMPIRAVGACPRKRLRQALRPDEPLVAPDDMASSSGGLRRRLRSARCREEDRKSPHRRAKINHPNGAPSRSEDL